MGEEKIIQEIGGRGVDESGEHVDEVVIAQIEGGAGHQPHVNQKWDERFPAVIPHVEREQQRDPDMKRREAIMADARILDDVTDSSADRLPLEVAREPVGEELPGTHGRDEQIAGDSQEDQREIAHHDSPECLLFLDEIEVQSDPGQRQNKREIDQAQEVGEPWMNPGFHEEGGLFPEDPGINFRQNRVRGMRVDSQDEVGEQGIIAGAQEQKREPIPKDFEERLEEEDQKPAQPGVSFSPRFRGRQQPQQGFQPENPDGEKDEDKIMHAEAEGVKQPRRQEKNQERQGNSRRQDVLQPGAQQK